MIHIGPSTAPLSSARLAGAPTTPSPRTSVVSDRVREAAANGTRLRVAGRGTWLDAGRPVPADDVLLLDGLSGILEYVPGDLTLTALAGTPLDEIERAARSERQWLPFDPFGAETGTLGATVATASYGPLAHAFGLPRDNVLGVEFVSGSGDVVRGGGRVVKNVAGFDLVRLVVGSWGTLGALTEVTVRLRALPEADVTVALVLPDDADAARALVGRVVAAQRTELAPVALELLSATLAAAIAPEAGASGHALLVARLAGNTPLVVAQRTALATMGDALELRPSVWRALRASDAPGSAVVRLSHLPAFAFDTWLHATTAARWLAGAHVHASLGRGVARVVVPSPEVPRLAAAFAPGRFALGSQPGTQIFERLPAELWPTLATSPLGGTTGSGRLSRRVKRAFDPKGVLNPGILGEEYA
ncbi:MAG TPA: FAD-binding oxidoreductase [Gemmatimonadaceae bacterium]|nr:FAD-binding oxidoreductase [Gemmatimonadaceae bacterium]